MEQHPVINGEAAASPWQRVQSLVDQTQHRTGIPGISVAVSTAGELLCTSAGTGELGSGRSLTPSARFQLGCITKLLTGMVGMQLAQESRLCLDAPVEEYLPELSGVSAVRGVKVWHLGSHTSGYRGLSPARPEYGYFYAWSKFVEFLRTTEQIFEPGTVFNYEHTESVLLGEIIQRVSGESCAELMQRWILEPLHWQMGTIAGDGALRQLHVAEHAFNPIQRSFRILRSVAYCDFWKSSLSDLTTSAADLAIFGGALLGTARLPGLSLATAGAISTPLVRVPATSGGARRELLPHSFGFGCAQYAGMLLGHNGSARGQTCGFRYSPERNFAVAVALNAWQPHVRDSLIETIAEIVAPQRAAEVAAVSALPAPDLSQVEGSYVGCIAGVGISIERKGDRFLCTVCGSAGAGQERLTLTLAPNAAGQLVASDIGHQSMGFFQTHEMPTPCLMLGLNAFKKVS